MREINLRLLVISIVIIVMSWVVVGVVVVRREISIGTEH